MGMFTSYGHIKKPKYYVSMNHMYWSQKTSIKQ